MAASAVTRRFRNKMKTMDFSVWLGKRRRHGRSHDNNEQQRQAVKDAFSCFETFGSQY